MSSAALVQLLEASIDPKQHRQGMHCYSHPSRAFADRSSTPAEKALDEQAKQPDFPVRLLEITASSSYSETTRLSGALCFKNLIRKSWTNEDGAHLLPPDVVNVIKTEIVGLMIASPPRIQAQLGDAISVIADSDFGERWQTLVDVGITLRMALW